MKNLLYFLFILICLNCNKKQETAPTFENCPSILDARVLTVEERANACIYLDVYSFKSKLYVICECCVCDKVYSAIDCNGEDLFKNSPKSISDFQLHAKYLFTIEQL